MLNAIWDNSAQDAFNQEQCEARIFGIENPFSGFGGLNQDMIDDRNWIRDNTHRLADEIYLGFGTPDFNPPQGQHMCAAIPLPKLSKENALPEEWKLHTSNGVKQFNSSQDANSKNQLLNLSRSPNNIDANISAKDFSDPEEASKLEPSSDMLSKEKNNECPPTKRLALRSDVMNKNFFRAFRRECKTLFSKFLNQNLLSASKNKRVFLTNLGKYSDYLLNDTETGRELTPYVDCVEFENYLGMFVNTCVMKKKLTSTKLQEFNEILYAYSHKKFRDFMSIPEVVAIVKITFSQVSMEGFISRNPALASNAEEYTGHITKILEEL